MKHRVAIIISIFLLVSCSRLAVANNEVGQHKELSCKEPFCTYAPPKLSGEVMADSVREIMKMADHVTSMDKNNVLLDDFINGKQFTFLSPYLVVEHRGDPALKKLFSESCLVKITEKNYLSKPNGEDSGPFYLYDIQLPNEDLKRKAMFVYGLASNPYKDAVIGYFVIFDSGSECTFLHKISIWGWDFRLRTEENQSRDVRPKKFDPEFAGLGYYKHAPFIYYFQGYSKNNIHLYNFIWYHGEEQFSNAKEFKSPSTTANFQRFPKTFNPYDIVNQKLQEVKP